MDGAPLRLFVGLRVGPEARPGLGRCASRLARDDDALRPTAEADLHLTLQFLGATRPDLVPALSAALAPVASDTPPIDVLYRGLGSFPPGPGGVPSGFSGARAARWAGGDQARIGPLRRPHTRPRRCGPSASHPAPRCAPVQPPAGKGGHDPGPGARVLFAGVHEPGPPRLPGLAAQVGRALLPLGVEPERRAFHAHVTLARVIPGRVLAPRTRIRMEREAAADLGAERLSVLALILSLVGAPRYPYKDLTTYELSGEASR